MSALKVISLISATALILFSGSWSLAEMTEEGSKADRIYNCGSFNPKSMLYIKDNSVKMLTGTGVEEFKSNGSTKTIGGVAYESFTGSKGNNIYRLQSPGFSNNIVMTFSYSKASSLDDNANMDCARLEDKSSEESYIRRLGLNPHPEYIRNKSEMEDLGKEINLNADGSLKGPKKEVVSPKKTTEAKPKKKKRKPKASPATTTVAIPAAPSGKGTVPIRTKMPETRDLSNDNDPWKTRRTWDSTKPADPAMAR